MLGAIRTGTVPLHPIDVGLRSGLCVGQSRSFTPNWENHVFMDPALCYFEAKNGSKSEADDSLKYHCML